MSKFYKDVAHQLNHFHPHKVYVAMSGGGQSFAYHYLKYSGASNSIAGIRIPYGRKDFVNFVGRTPSQFVCEDTARLMAISSYKACLEEVDETVAVGIGVTCSLATDDERIGREHKMYLAIHNYEYTMVYSIILKQGLTRDQEEDFCCLWIFKMLNNLINHPVAADDDLNQLCNIITTTAPYITTFECKRANRADFDTEIPEDATEVAIAPGSWDPAHEGHFGVIKLAGEILGIKPYIELTTKNADKGIIDYLEVEKRLGNLKEFNKLLTSATTFLEKARLLARPYRTIYFVVGTDTWNRILDPKYAGDMFSLYDLFVQMNAKFLVVNRESAPMLSHVVMDELLIKDDRLNSFNIAISSTEIRKQQAESA